MTDTTQALRDALAAPGCERLREWSQIGPVQRAALEEFAAALAETAASVAHGLGPLPPADLIASDGRSAWRGSTVSGYALAEVARAVAAERSTHTAALDARAAEERARIAADADKWGNALNDASWALVEAYRKHTGQVDPPLLFNYSKAILRDAIEVYIRALGAPTTDKGE